MTDAVVAIDAVHPALLALCELRRRRALGHVFLDLALRVGHLHKGNRLPVRIGRDVADVDAGIGVPVDRFARGGRLPGAADVHLQDRGRLGVRFVVRELANDADAIAKSPLGRVTGAADLEGRPQVGDTRDRLGNLAGHDVVELPDADQLVVDRRPRAVADVAVDAGDARMCRRLPGGELRVHRQVARLPAESRRFHRVQRSIPGEQQDHQVDGGQRADDQGRAADVRPAEVQHGPILIRLGMEPQLPPLQPHVQPESAASRARRRRGGR